MSIDADSRCHLSPGCEFGPHAPSDHPCGRPAEMPGDPCRHCGEPVPGPEINGGACPNCWAPITIADAKALFAPHGMSVDTATGEVHR